MNSLQKTLLALAFVAAAGASHAAEVTDTFQVRLTILESCSISSASTDIDFLEHTRSAAANVAANGTLTVNCSAGTPFTIGLTGGLHSEADSAAPSAGDRRMSSGNGYVPYDLYQDGGFGQFWGNSAADMQAGTGTASDQTFTVYGRVPSTNFPAGVYVDTVTARVVY